MKISDRILPSIVSYKNSFVSFSEIPGPAPYKPTYNFSGSFINANHQYYSQCPTGRMGSPLCIDIGIDGWLQRDDALKIYELSYFSSGDILELGTFCGLATSIIAQAITDSGFPIKFSTVELDPEAHAEAQKNVRTNEGASYVDFNLCDANEYMDKAIVQGKKYSFVFVDHWHGYDATYNAAMRIKKLLHPGGFCLFHDYNDPANTDPNHHYGVYQAVHDTILCDPQFEFYGTFGCAALFRKCN